MMRRLRLSRVPRFQILLGHTLLRASYSLPRRTRIEIEGLENVPRDRTVFFAMNHTDRYNYWPFQYGMWKRGRRYTATWVKGKYYENPWMARFMIATNNIPLPSRGYVIATEFRKAMGRAPDSAEYRVLRDTADGVASGDGGETVKRFVAEGGLPRFEETFRLMIAEVLRLTRSALFELNQDVLVFPQGTRSVRLSRGHTGLAQAAISLGVPIVPVGSNGSEKLYPGGSPWSKGGRVVYRVGAPIEPPKIAEPFEPLTPAATRAQGDTFRALTDLVMSRIEVLLDPEYRFAEGGTSDGVKEMDRFL